MEQKKKLKTVANFPNTFEDASLEAVDLPTLVITDSYVGASPADFTGC